MQENKFENRVQQQMEEFRIRPSEAVWEKVEEELRKKKKRRVVFYLSLFAGLGLLGYSGYFIYNGSKPNLLQQPITTSQGNDRPIKENDELPSIGNSTGKLEQSRKENQLSGEEKRNSSVKSDIGLKEKKITTEEKIVVNEQEIATNNLTTKKSLPVVTINEENVVVNNKPVQNREMPSLKNADLATKPRMKADISQPAIAEIKLKTDRVLSTLNENITVKRDNLSGAVAVINEEVPSSKIKLNQDRKIMWGIDISVGISAHKENIFSIYGGQKSSYMDYSSSPNTGGVNSPLASIRSPSAIQSNPAFRFGVAGEKKLSRKSSISSGLRYAYYSNKMKVGAYTDTVIALSSSFSQASRLDAIYIGTYQKVYDNRFHFIELPIQYQLQLNKGIKLPITWNAGVSVGYLVSTNSLVYDTTAGGIYYRSKDAFNKVQFNLNTGFSFRFGNKSKVQWSLGPELSLGLNKLMKSDFTKKQYLLYSGITGRIIFAKKK